MQRKTCAKCSKTRLIKFFYRDDKTCTTCRIDKQKEYKQIRIDEGRTYKPIESGYKTCKRCNVSKSVKKFTVNKLSKDGRSSYCVNCAGKYYKPVKRSNEVKEYYREYYNDYRCNPIHAKRLYLAQRIGRLKSAKLLEAPSKCKCGSDQKLFAHINHKTVYKSLKFKVPDNELIKSIQWRCSKCICKMRDTK